MKRRKKYPKRVAARTAEIQRRIVKRTKAAEINFTNLIGTRAIEEFFQQVAFNGVLASLERLLTREMQLLSMPDVGGIMGLDSISLELKKSLKIQDLRDRKRMIYFACLRLLAWAAAFPNQACQ